MTDNPQDRRPGSSLDVRERLIEALNLDLVGPWADHPLADECLPGWIRPSNWYLTGFLIPSGSAAENSADPDEDDDMDGEVPESAGLAEESSEERKAAKKGYFPSSMGLSFLVPKEEDALEVTVSWGDYEPVELEDDEGKTVSVWQRTPRLEKLPLKLGDEDPGVSDVPESGGLVLHVVQREVLAESLEDHIPPGTRSVSVFIVNNRPPADTSADCAYVFQPELRVRGGRPFVPRPDLRGTRADRWDDQSGRPSLRGHALVRHRPRSIGRLGDPRRRVPLPANRVDPSCRGRKDGDRRGAGGRAGDGGSRLPARRNGRRTALSGRSSNSTAPGSRPGWSK